MTDPSYQVDLGGNDLIANNLYIGATGPGQAGSLLNVTDLTGITPGTAAANKSVVLGASKEIATITTATVTNLTSTTVTPTTIAGNVNFTGTPTFAAGNTVTAGLRTLGATSTTKSNAGSQTCTSNACTTTTQFTKVTTESLTTAHTASQAIVVTYTGTASTDFAVATIIGGTNTQGVPVLKTACTTDTVTITIQNNAIATNAFNGTFIIWLQVFKA